MLGSLAKWGLSKIVAKPVAKKNTAKLTPAQEILVAADAVLRRKSKDRFHLDYPTFFEHPHVFGCLIDSGNAKVAQAVAFSSDIQDTLSRCKYHGQVFIRLDPLRLEILKPEPKALLFENYWPKIVASEQNAYKFNGVLFYKDTEEHLLGFSIAKTQYAHCGFFGATGSGKTVLLYNAILSLAMRNSPELVSIVLCDKTGQNLPLMNGLPHLATRTVVKIEDIETAIRLVYQELMRRGETQDRRIGEKKIVLVIDEFNNILDSIPDAIQWCTEIAREGRQRGVHLWVCGQKMAGSKSMSPEFYQNLNARFVGSTGGNKIEAIINSGEGSMAHKLPTGQGIFEFRNGGSVLNIQTPVLVRSLYIEDKRVEIDIPKYVAQIRDRWGGSRPHFTMGGWRREEGRKAVIEPTVKAVISMRKQEGPVRPADVVKIYQEWTGRDLNFTEARRLLGST